MQDGNNGKRELAFCVTSSLNKAATCLHRNHSLFKECLFRSVLLGRKKIHVAIYNVYRLLAKLYYIAECNMLRQYFFISHKKTVKKNRQLLLRVEPMTL